MESRRRVAAALTVAGVVLIVAGLAAVAIDSGLTNGGPTVSLGTASPSRPTTSPTATRVSSATPTASASPSRPAPTGSRPSPTPVKTPRPIGFAVVGSQIFYFSPDGTTELMPQIVGLTAKLVDTQAIYYAASSNKFGLRTGDYAGEFMPNVATQQADGSSAQTGGVVLVGNVVNRLIENHLADVAAPADRWTVVLPVDIRGTEKLVDVSFDGFGLHGWSDTPRVVVRFSGELRVANIIPGNAGYHVLVEELGVTTWQAIDPTRLTLSSEKLDTEHLMNELLVYGSGTPNVATDVLVDNPVPIGKTMLLASSDVSVSLVVRGSRADLGPDRILKIGDVPVFAASS
jgi:hypothetical protein